MVRVGAVIWTSSRVQELIDFYKLLGIYLAADTHAEPGGTPHFEADIGGVHYAVFPAKDSAPQGDLGSGPGSTAGGTMLGFAVDNIVELSAELHTRGVKFRTPLQDTPWGKRVVVFDPDGRPLEIYQAPE